MFFQYLQYINIILPLNKILCRQLSSILDANTKNEKSNVKPMQP